MLRVAIHRLVFAEHTIDDAGRLFVVDFPLFAEVDAAYPLVLYLFEGRFDFEYSGKFIEQIPESLVLAIDIAVFGSFADEA